MTNQVDNHEFDEHKETNISKIGKASTDMIKGVGDKTANGIKSTIQVDDGSIVAWTKKILSDLFPKKK